VYGKITDFAAKTNRVCAEKMPILPQKDESSLFGIIADFAAKMNRVSAEKC
jgi:hypothetical protein